MIPPGAHPNIKFRLGLCRRISALASEAESEAMEAELVDRFGTVPPELKNLLDVVELKRNCRAAGIERLEASPKGMVLQFRGNHFANPEGLIRWMAKWTDGTVRLRPDHKLAVVRELTNVQRIDLARRAPGN